MAKATWIVFLFAWALPGLAARLFSASDPPPLPTGSDKKHLLLQDIVDRVETQTRDRQQRLESVPVRFPGGSEPAYNVEDVETAIEKGKQELVKELGDNGLQGLGAYVDVYYPAANLSVLRGDNEQLLATKSSTDEIIEKISAFLRRLRSIEKLSLSLKLVSLPSEAQFELWPIGNDKARFLAVANQELQLYRGLYKYRVYKAGFKPSEYMLNLVDQTGSVLECRLYKGEESDGPYPCLLK